jgi:hypothetical protein
VGNEDSKAKKSIMLPLVLVSLRLVGFVAANSVSPQDFSQLALMFKEAARSKYSYLKLATFVERSAS